MLLLKTVTCNIKCIFHGLIGRVSITLVMFFLFAGVSKTVRTMWKSRVFSVKSRFIEGHPMKKTVPCWLLTRLHFHLFELHRRKSTKTVCGVMVARLMHNVWVAFWQNNWHFGSHTTSHTTEKTYTLKTATNQLFILCLLQLRCLPDESVTSYLSTGC